MGNKTINNFDPNFPAPLDSRVVVDNITARDALVTDGKVYEGIIAYVKDNGSDEAVMQMYVNTGTVAIPVLEWITIGTGGGGITIHNDLTGIQGGTSNTEHYHLNQRQFDWVVDTVPFISPTVTVNSNEGPTWSWETDLSTVEPIVLTGSIIINEGLNCRIRLWDIPNNQFLIPDTGGQDVDGYVTAGANTLITYTFSTGNYPVDTTQISGDSHSYRADILYDDLDGATDLSKSDNLTYVAEQRHIDEIWWTPVGVTGNPTTVPPSSIGAPTFEAVTQHDAESPGVTMALDPTGSYPVFVISDDLTGGDSTKVEILQNGTPIFREGTVNNSTFNVIPYTGDITASAGSPSITFTQFGAVAPSAGTQPFTIKIY